MTVSDFLSQFLVMDMVRSSHLGLVIVILALHRVSMLRLACIDTLSFRFSLVGRVIIGPLDHFFN